MHCPHHHTYQDSCLTIVVAVHATSGMNSLSLVDLRLISIIHGSGFPLLCSTALNTPKQSSSPLYQVLNSPFPFLFPFAFLILLLLTPVPLFPMPTHSGPPNGLR